jgi:hypothetical protein
MSASTLFMQLSIDPTSAFSGQNAATELRWPKPPFYACHHQLAS